MISIHPDAKRNFIEKTENILSYFEPFKPKPIPPRTSQHYITKTITENDLVNKIKYQNITNQSGENVGLVVFTDSEQYFINRNNYKIIKKIIEQLSVLKGYNEYLSKQYIETKMCDWLASRFLKEFEVDFIQFIEMESGKDIKLYEVWIPIPYTSSVKEFSLGNITFKIITQSVILDWFKDIPDKNADSKKDKEQFIKELQKNFQGYISGIFIIKSEQYKAKEMAFNELKNTLSILRLFSPANFHPSLINGAYEYGWNVYESEKSIFFSKEGNEFLMNTSMRDIGLYWTIDEKVIEFLNSDANKNYNEILKSQNRNNFQEDIFKSLIIYSKHTLKRDVSDKIMYILVSLESILLKNDTEPIQQNLADRMAFICSKNPDGRKEIVKLVKYIYQIRSKFIHHGVPSVDSIDKIVNFLDLAWNTFHLIILNMTNFENKDSFIDEIEKIKYS
ncbi:MAG TPA: HEPN domain-containing protein [Spirochaetota bacterium]|nr:HEPN domain-containing protein [Spirochaetota bacterium]